MSEHFYAAFPVEDIPKGKSKALDIDGNSVLVCNVNGEYLAVQNRCTHQGADLEGGRIRNGMIACPLHGVLFDLKTGCGRGPLGKTPLKTYQTRVRDGIIEVSLEELVES